jgi:hypothetical protein
VRTRYGLAAVVVLALSVAGCVTTHHRTVVNSVPAPSQSYSDTRISFTYPAAWKRLDPGFIAGVGGKLYPFMCVGTALPESCGGPAAFTPAERCLCDVERRRFPRLLRLREGSTARLGASAGCMSCNRRAAWDRSRMFRAPRPGVGHRP